MLTSRLFYFMVIKCNKYEIMKHITGILLDRFKFRSLITTNLRTLKCNCAMYGLLFNTQSRLTSVLIKKKDNIRSDFINELNQSFI